MRILLHLLIYFNPIIVLFLTSVDELTSLVNNFNPIIVLFLTCRMTDTSKHLEKFQSYYSLISNYNNYRVKLKLLLYFNPIIVLFLTPKEVKKIICPYWFQSYYSLISNPIYLGLFEKYLYFNPIIVLFLTKKLQ